MDVVANVCLRLCPHGVTKNILKGIRSNHLRKLKNLHPMDATHQLKEDYLNIKNFFLIGKGPEFTHKYS